MDSYRGSKGPVICIDTRPSSPDWGNTFSDIFLSCGEYWINYGLLLKAKSLF